MTYESQLECCEKAYSGQSSGACIFSLPSSVRDTLPVVWFPVYAEQICVSTEFEPRNHGVNGYKTQLECCKKEYGHGDDDMERCFQGLPNPPTISPTPVGGLSIWWPDYSRAFNSGVCINKGPIPDGIVTYPSQLECCNIGEFFFVMDIDFIRA